MPRRKNPSYETPNSVVVQKRAYTIMSEDAHILEGAGLGARQTTPLQSLIDKVCPLFPAKSGLMSWAYKATHPETESSNPPTRKQRYRCNPCITRNQWCLAARAITDPNTGISAPPRNAKGVLCSGCSRSRITVGQESDWDH
jgi:hypothetical protein